MIWPLPHVSFLSLSLSFFSQIAGSLGADGITSNCCVGAQRHSAETAGEAEAPLQDGAGLGGGGCWPTAAGTGRCAEDKHPSTGLVLSESEEPHACQRGDYKCI